MSPKRESMHILFLIIFLTVLESRSQYCGSKNGRKICCSGFWYEQKNNQCLKCPDGYYGQNCSDACPFPYFGELCKHICNCSSAMCHRVGGCFPENSAGSTICQGIDGVTCCTNYWYDAENHECVGCNPGYFGFNCMGICSFPFYGELCAQSCNCSVEDCNHVTGCSIPKIEPNDKNPISGKIEELSQKRIYLRVSAYALVGILTVFVIIFIGIELYQRTGGSFDEQMICTDNEPAYQDITINEEDGDLFISEQEHFLNEPAENPPEIETTEHNEMAEMEKSIIHKNHHQNEAIELSKRHSRCDSSTNYSEKIQMSDNILSGNWNVTNANFHKEVQKERNMVLDDTLQVEISIHDKDFDGNSDFSYNEICCGGCLDNNIEQYEKRSSEELNFKDDKVIYVNID